MTNTMKKMSFAEFEKKYMQGTKRWDFSKFGIVCKKCGSSKVEYNNDIEAELEYGYYDDCSISRSGCLVVKCHDCGNAVEIDAYSMTVKETP